MSKYVTEEVLKQAAEDIIRSLGSHIVEYEPYTDDEIAELYNLTPEEVQQLSELIRDDIISQYKLWSSKKVDSSITDAKLECNEYTDKMLSNISSISLEWCETSLPVTGETNKIYIFPKTTDGNTVNTLNIWSTTSSDWVTFGNLDIDFSQFYTKSEIDTKLDLKANKTEVLSQDGVIVDKSLATTANVLSATTTVEELDKKIDKTSIVTSITDSSTDEQISTAKAIYNSIINGKLGCLKYNTEYMNSDTLNIFLPNAGMYKIGSPTKGVPENNLQDYTLFNIPWMLTENNNFATPTLEYGCQLLFSPRFINSFWYRVVWGYDKDTYTYTEGDYSVFTKWRVVNTTSIENINPTTLTYDTSVVSEGTISYEVRNGICYISFISVKLATTGTNQIISSTLLPKPSQGFATFSLFNDSVDIRVGTFFIDGSGYSKVHCFTANTGVWQTFSYPVAES